MPRRRAAIVLAIVVALLAGCSDGGGDYSDATEQVFLRACNPERRSEYDDVCRCAYDEIRRTRSFDEFVELNRQIEKDPDDVPDDVVEIVTDCGSRDNTDADENGGFGFSERSDESDQSDQTDQTDQSDQSNQSDQSDQSESSR